MLEGAHAIIVALAGHVLPGHMRASIEGDDLAAIVRGAFAALFGYNLRKSYCFVTILYTKPLPLFATPAARRRHGNGGAYDAFPPTNQQPSSPNYRNGWCRSG